MSQAVSPSTNRPYGLALVCRTLELSRSSVYARLERQASLSPPNKRGPKTAWSDEQLLTEIRKVLAASPWTGEGHRKVWARLRFQGTRTSLKRVLRLMREAGLLAPTRAGQAHGPAAHDGTIITETPNEMWGIDATRCLTGEANAAVFVCVDHATAECVAIHAAVEGNRFEAVETLRQGIREFVGPYQEGIADGLAIRHDHGSCFMADVFQTELRFLGASSSPAYVREPEGNGCAERFIRTLKEQLLWVRTFETVEELRQALHEFKVRYNNEWLIGRHGHRSPSEARRLMLSQEQAA